MKVTCNTPDRLTLQHRPLMLSVALAFGSLLLLSIGLWNLVLGEWLKAGVALLATPAIAGPAVWFGAEKTGVVFDAVAWTCLVDTRRLSGGLQEVYTLDQIEKAIVQTHKSPGAGAGAHRVALVLSPGGPDDLMPLTVGYAGGQWAKDAVTRINTWLDARRLARNA